MIKYAKENGKKIVARSGGHQYSGKSSGGSDTIVVSMDRFDKIKFITDNIVEVGACCKLRDVAKLFAKHHITVPHGECPYVSFGGHAQTGGYGHIFRGFGILHDYISSFYIVLANGTRMHVKRPKKDSNPTKEK